MESKLTLMIFYNDISEFTKYPQKNPCFYGYGGSTTFYDPMLITSRGNSLADWYYSISILCKH